MCWIVKFHHVIWLWMWVILDVLTTFDWRDVISFRTGFMSDLWLFKDCRTYFYLFLKLFFTGDCSKMTSLWLIDLIPTDLIVLTCLIKSQTLFEKNLPKHVKFQKNLKSSVKLISNLITHARQKSRNLNHNQNHNYRIVINLTRN